MLVAARLEVAGRQRPDGAGVAPHVGRPGEGEVRLQHVGPGLNEDDRNVQSRDFLRVLIRHARHDDPGKARPCHVGQLPAVPPLLELAEPRPVLRGVVENAVERGPLPLQGQRKEDCDVCHAPIIAKIQTAGKTLCANVVKNNAQIGVVFSCAEAYNVCKPIRRIPP